MALRPGTSVGSHAVATSVTVELVGIRCRTVLCVLVGCTRHSLGWIVATSFFESLDVILVSYVCGTDSLNIVSCDEGEELHSSLTFLATWTQGTGGSRSGERLHTATLSTSVVVDDSVTVIVQTVTLFLCGLVDNVLEGIGQRSRAVRCVELKTTSRVALFAVGPT